MSHQTSVTLDDHSAAFIEQQLQKGNFKSTNEILAAGLKRLEADEIKLTQLRERLETGELSPLTENFNADSFIHELHEKYKI